MMTRTKALLSLATVLVTALLLSASAQAVTITEVDLAGNRLEMVNETAGSFNMSAWQWCNRVNGSPFYSSFGTIGTIDAALSTPGTSFANFQAGDIMVVTLNDAFLPDAGGEMGIYSSGSFGSAAAIVDYVAWGTPTGFRDTVAQTAGIWTDNDQLALPAAGDTIQLNFGSPGNAASDYSSAAATLGVFVPEPSSVAILMLGMLSMAGVVRRRK